MKRQTKTKKSDAKRRKILETAYLLFRARGFDKTSVSEITSLVGGSKATVYSHFPSKEELFVESMLAAAESYIEGAQAQLDESRGDLDAVLHDFGKSFLEFLCSPDMIAVRRLMIAEAARSGLGKLFYAKIASMRAQVAAFLSHHMESGRLRRDDPELAAHHLRGLLEAEMVEPLLLRVRKGALDKKEVALVAERAINAFLRAYAPEGKPSR